MKSGHTSNIYIFHKLGAGLINQLGQLVEDEKLQEREPQLFSLFWEFPIVLILLAHSKRLEVNSKKVERIFDYLLPSLISLFPRLHSNRLYLLLGIESVLKEIDSPDLKKHALFIKKSIDIEVIFYSECKSLNICIMDGVSGLRLISEKLAELTGDKSIILSNKLIFQKINESVCWGEHDIYSSFKKSIGLLSGLSGIGWTLLKNLEVGEKHDIVKI